MSNTTISTQASKHKLQHWLMLLLLALIWGSSFILMKKGLVVFSNTQVAAIRVFFTMLAMLPFAPKWAKSVPKNRLPHLAAIGLVGTTIPAFLFATAQTQLNSATTGILNSLTPIFVFILGILFFKVSFQPKRLLGVILGFVGASTLIGTSAINDGGNSNYWYGLYALLATMGYGTSVNLVKTYCQNIHPIAINVVSLLMVGPFVGVFLFSTNFIALLSTPEGLEAFIYLLILALIGTAFATIIFFRLTQQTDALFASTVTYLIPIVALLWGIIDGETIGWHYPISMGIILSGVYLAARAGK